MSSARLTAVGDEISVSTARLSAIYAKNPPLETLPLNSKGFLLWFQNGAGLTVDF